MKQIIKKPIHFEATCHMCGVVFTYQKEDCEEFPFRDRVDCPNCGERLVHTEKNAVYKELQIDQNTRGTVARIKEWVTKNSFPEGGCGWPCVSTADLMLFLEEKE